MEALQEVLIGIKSFLYSFLIFNVNGFNTVAFFIKQNMLLFATLFSIGYVTYKELQLDNLNYVNDKRKII